MKVDRCAWCNDDHERAETLRLESSGYCCQQCELRGRFSSAIESELNDMSERMSRADILEALEEVGEQLAKSYGSEVSHAKIG